MNEVDKKQETRCFGCDKKGNHAFKATNTCVICQEGILPHETYYDTYYQPLCLDCLKELHKL